jgi:hypothetical protein
MQHDDQPATQRTQRRGRAGGHEPGVWAGQGAEVHPFAGVAKHGVNPVQWVCAVGLDMYPASTELQTLWMTSAIVLLAGTSPRAVVRAASAIGIMLLLAYLLALAELRAAITLAWAVVALTALVAGSRVNDRILWIAGAGVSTLVVTKLIGLDMHTASPIWRVLSFIGSGLLFVLAGYLAPAPVKNAGRSGAAMHRP